MNKLNNINMKANVLRIAAFNRELVVVVEGLVHTFFISPYGRELVMRLGQKTAKNNREALKEWASNELKSMGISSPVSGMRHLCVRLANALETYDYIGND